jgi:hypothetical protein
MARKGKSLENDLGWVTKAQIARLLSEEAGREITIRQVWAWVDRRANSGFPEPKDVVLQRGRQTPRFDPLEVIAWFRQYVPNKGGRPFMPVPS